MQEELQLTRMVGVNGARRQNVLEPAAAEFSGQSALVSQSGMERNKNKKIIFKI